LAIGRTIGKRDVAQTDNGKAEPSTVAISPPERVIGADPAPPDDLP
jgi:hypothetical protein